MGGGGRVDDKALHVSHVSQQGENLQIVDEGPSLLFSALHFEGEDASATVGEEFLVESMVRMIRQRRMVHLCHLWMVGEEFNNLCRVVGMTLHTQRQCLKTLQQNPCVEWRYGGTSVAQDDGTNTSDESSRTSHIGKHSAMIAWVWLCY